MALLCSIFSSNALAAWHEAKDAEIIMVRTHMKSHKNAVWQGYLLFSIDKPIDGCSIYEGSTLLVVDPNDNLMFSTILAAKSSKQKVRVFIDTDYQYQGYCKLQALDIQ